MSTRRMWLVGLALLCTALLASPAQARDDTPEDGFTVDAFIDGQDASPGDGSCATSGDDCTLRAAVEEANALEGADQILLGEGTYTLTLVGDEDEAANGDLDVIDDLTITGLGADLSIIDGNGATTGDRVLHVLDPGALGVDLVLEALTITGGSVLNRDGGGLYIEAAEGGGPPVGEPLSVFDETGGVTATLTNVEVVANVADSNQNDPETGKPIGGSGGGIASAGALTVDESRVTGNTAAANGGGIYSGAAMLVRDSTVADNEAEGGGGIFDTGSHVSILETSTVSGNVAVGGGGITLRTQVVMQIENCTVDGNFATDVGAGIQSNGIIDLLNVTLADNDSETDAPNGGAALNSFASGSFRLENVLMANNTKALGAIVANCGCTGGTGCTQGAQFVSFGHNLEDVDSCGLDDESDLVDTDPELLPLADYGGPTLTRALAATSPAVDAGSDTACPAVDQRGVERPVDGDLDETASCDIGSFERVTRIFASDFEVGDLSEWDLATPEI